MTRHKLTTRLKILGGTTLVALVPTLTSGVLPAAADELNFGHCASYVARVAPPGPIHGQVMRLASIYNPSGVGLECPKPPPGNP